MVQGDPNVGGSDLSTTRPQEQAAVRSCVFTPLRCPYFYTPVYQTLESILRATGTLHASLSFCAVSGLALLLQASNAGPSHLLPLLSSTIFWMTRYQPSPPSSQGREAGPPLSTGARLFVGIHLYQGMDTDCRSNHLPYYTHDTPDALDAHDTNRGGPYPPHPNSMAQNGTDVAAYYSQSSPAEQCGASATSADWYSCIMESAPDTAQSRLHQTLPPPRALSRAESLWSSSAGPSFSGNDNGNAEYALGATGRPIALPDQASPRTLPPESLGSGQERSLVSSGTVDAEIGCLPHTLFGALSSVGAGFPYLQNLSDGTTGASPYFARDVGIDTLSAPEGRTYYYPAGNAFDTSSSAPGAYQDDREDLSLCGGVDVKPDPDDDMASVMHSELDDTEVRTRYRDGMLKTEPSSVAGETPSDAGSIAQDEPYAKLIWRAFKSVPTNSMTLQDLYQWFRENTFKAKGEGKGWQNSIRHNLSMNAVCALGLSMSLALLLPRSPG